MRTACAILVALVCAAWAPPAHAVAILVDDGELIILPTVGEANRVTITREGDAYRVTDTGAAFFGGCPQIPNEPAVLCPAAGVSSIFANLGDGDDQIIVEVPLPARIYAHEGNDLIVSGTGDDRLFGGSGADEVYGGEGDDELWEEGTDPNRLDGGPGADRVVGGSGPDTITGGPGDDPRLYGFDGDDTIDGGAGDDVLDGGSGPKGLRSDADSLAGGPGIDTVTYNVHGFPTQISIGNGAGDGVPGEGDDVRGDIERLIGSEGFDELVGGPGPDFIDGAGAADVIDGGPGDDTLVGGGDGSADTIRGGDGTDLLRGGAGGDALDGGPGIDLLAGGSDDDQLAGGPDTDLLYGEDGDDRLDGGGGPDLLSGGEGTDTVRYAANVPVQVTLDGVANDGAVTLSKDGRSRVEEGARSEGDDVDATNERVDGSGVDDTVSGDADPNGLSGASGEDFLDGHGGADTLSGGGRGDTIVARDGRRDRVSCGAGRDYVVADPIDLIDRAADCEYVDDGSTTRPSALRDVTVKPDCSPGADADLSPPGMRREVPLAQTARVPTGTLVDSFDCDVVVTAASAGSVRLGQKTGTMRITQRRVTGGAVRTMMRSMDCLTTARAAAAIAHASRYPQPRYRRRYGRVGVHVDVRLDTAMIRTRRGVATYEVDDRCGRGATVTVKSGRLSVIDLATGVTHKLGPGQERVTL